MKIYTRTGDKGETSLWGGTRVPKNHLKIEAYGTIDELNSFLGLLVSHNIDQGYKEQLISIQENLFTIGAILAAEPDKAKLKVPVFDSVLVTQIENWIDEMDLTLPELHSFILPGGSKEASFCHVARCVCRRAERQVVSLDLKTDTGNLIITYLNRLSDYLFVLARKLSQDKGIPENLWKPGY